MNVTLRRWCPCCLGENYYQAIARGSLEETWSLCACILPSPRRCPIFCEILNPLRVVRLEGGEYISEYELAFPETAWDVGYLTHLCFHSHPIKPTKPERTVKVTGETILDHVVFWFGHADWQVKTRRFPFSLWDLQVRLFSPHLGRKRNGNISVSLSGNIRST